MKRQYPDPSAPFLAVGMEEKFRKVFELRRWSSLLDGEDNFIGQAVLSRRVKGMKSGNKWVIVHQTLSQAKLRSC